jgi:cytochrome c oxidase cbb3-type subunit 3
MIETETKYSKGLPEGAPDDPLTGHDYDGIQEYDNPLPGWWKWLFVASIVLTPPYLFWYHNGAQGRSVADQFDRALAANLQLQFAEIGELTADRENVVKFLYEENWLQVGKAVFKTHCVSCHGKDGGGLVGPNLCDDSYKNVKDIGDILTVLQKGANAGAMPAWSNRLSTNEIVLASSYVASLRGSSPAVAKAAEGRVIDPWPAAPVEQEDSAAEKTDASETADGQ